MNVQTESSRTHLLRRIGKINDPKAVSNILRRALVRGRPSFVVGKLEAGEVIGVTVTSYFEEDSLKAKLSLHNIEVI